MLLMANIQEEEKNFKLLIGHPIHDSNNIHDLDMRP